MGCRKLFLLWSCLIVVMVAGSPVVQEIHLENVLDEPENAKPEVRPSSDLSLQDIPASLTSPSGNSGAIQPPHAIDIPKSSFTTIVTIKPSAGTVQAGQTAQTSQTVIAIPPSANASSAVATSLSRGTNNPQASGAPNATQPLKDYITVKTDADVTWCRPWPNTVVTTPSALHIYKLTELNLTCWVPTDLQVNANGSAQPDAHDIWVKTGAQGCYINENDLKASQLDFEFILRPCTAPGPYPLEPNPGKTTGAAGSIGANPTSATAKSTGGVSSAGTTGGLESSMTAKASPAASSALSTSKGPDLSSAPKSHSASLSPIAPKQPSSISAATPSLTVSPIPISPSPSPINPSPNLSSAASSRAATTSMPPVAPSTLSSISAVSTAVSQSPSVATSAVSSAASSAASSAPKASLPPAPKPQSPAYSKTLATSDGATSASVIPTSGGPGPSEAKASPSSSRTLTPIGQIYTPTFSSVKASQT